MHVTRLEMDYCFFNVRWRCPWELRIEHRAAAAAKNKTSNSPLLLLKCFSFFNDNHLKIFIAARSRSEMCWITIAQRNQPYNVSTIEAQQLIMTPKWEPISGHSCIQLIERNVNFFLLFLSCSLSLSSTLDNQHREFTFILAYNFIIQRRR